MKTVLLNANDDRGWEARYQAALDVARAFGSHLRCVQSTPLADTGDSLLGFFPYPEIAREMTDVAREHRKRVEAKLAVEGVFWDWQEFVGDAAQMLIACSPLADLVIVSSGAEGAHEPGHTDLAVAGTVAINARGPVLAVPPEAKRLNALGTALVAWNGSPESANAVRLALPMLGAATKVLVLTIGEEHPGEGRTFPAIEASEFLSRHTIASELHCWDQERRHVADVILEAAGTLRADYIVAGAYGHSRFREAALGGVTRALLHRSPIPVIMAH